MKNRFPSRSLASILSACGLAAALCLSACTLASQDRAGVKRPERQDTPTAAEKPVVETADASPDEGNLPVTGAVKRLQPMVKKGEGAGTAASEPAALHAYDMLEAAVAAPSPTGKMRYSGRRGFAKAACMKPPRPIAPGAYNYPNAQPSRPFHTEEYDRIYENPFLAAAANPLSTFSIDVDAASYANTRRFLQSGQMPPSDAVRIEEFVNYFDYAYPQPQGEDPFTIVTEMASAPWNPRHRLVHIGLQGRRIETSKLPPGNLVFLIDVSGSMDTPERLPLLKRAFHLLVDQLRPQDRVAMVVYAGAAGLVLPSTPGSDRESIHAALDNLQAGGSTAGGEGLMLAYDIARRHFIDGGNNRIILATDGDFNVGVSSDGELVRLVEEKRKTGVFLSVLGFGMGNYKDSKMEQLADKGNGNYAYIDNILEARKVLVEEIGGTLLTLAKDVKLQIEFNPAEVESYRLIGYENRMLRSEDFNDDAKDAGELGAGHSVTALYEVVPKGSGKVLPKVDPLKYGRRDDGGRGEHGDRGIQKSFRAPETDTEGEVLTVKFRYKQPAGTTSKLLSRVLRDSKATLESTSDDFRFSAAAAGFGMLLRGSEHKGDLGYDQVAQLAKGAKGRDDQGHRSEFIRLVETAKLLSAGQRVGSRGRGE